MSNSKPSRTIYFWRETEDPHGIFSQWAESPFEHEGVVYRTAEMWMMINKAKLFGDDVCTTNRLKQQYTYSEAGNCSEDAEDNLTKGA
jgi:predicted NAD-dependent protein-ADP-ribosyltransferase YbiA (DUF1768 family)